MRKTTGNLLLLSLAFCFFALTARMTIGALPNQLKGARLTDASLASTIDNEVGNLETAISDILGIPIDSNISNKLFTVTATGLTKVHFQDLAGDPAANGEFARNATLLKYHDGTAVRTLVSRDLAETLTLKTIIAPVLSGTVTGTYTLGGAPTIIAPVLSGTVSGTYTLGGAPTIAAPTIAAPVLSGTVSGTYTLGGDPTIGNIKVVTPWTITETSERLRLAGGVFAVGTSVTTGAVAGDLVLDGTATTASALRSENVAGTGTTRLIERANALNVVLLGGLWTWPGADGTSGQFIQTSGSGALSFTGAVSTLNLSTSDVTVTNTTTETNLYSFTVTGGTLGTDKSLILVIDISDFDGAASAILTLRLKYGGTTIAVLTSTADPTAYTNSTGRIVVTLRGDGATNAQLGSMSFEFEQVVNLGDLRRIRVAASAVDSTVNQTLAVTAQWAAGQATSSVTKGGATLLKSS